MDFSNPILLPIISPLSKVFIFTPIILKIKGETDPKIYGQPIFDEYFNAFDSKIQNTVINNQRFYIQKINGLDPFTYIQNFCSSYSSTKNPHGSFTLSYVMIGGPSLIQCPLSKDEIKDGFTVEYSNGNVFQSEYMLFSSADNFNSMNIGFHLQEDLEDLTIKGFKKFTRDFLRSDEYMNKIKNKEILSLIDFHKFYSKYIENENLSTLQNSQDIPGLIHYSDKMSCRTDNYFGVNFIYVNSFMTEGKTIEEKKNKFKYMKDQ